MVLADAGNGRREFLEGVRRLKLHALVSVSGKRCLADGTALQQLHRAGQQVRLRDLSMSLTWGYYFFKRKTLNARNSTTPSVINADKHKAYPPAMAALQEDKMLPQSTELRQNKYLNNVIEQDHRFLQRLIKPGLGFKSFHTARRTIKGYEAMHMIRKGQVIGVPKGEVLAQLNFMAQVLGVAA